jgi:hypothetical protein
MLHTVKESGCNVDTIGKARTIHSFNTTIQAFGNAFLRLQARGIIRNLVGYRFIS